MSRLSRKEIHHILEVNKALVSSGKDPIWPSELEESLSPLNVKDIAEFYGRLDFSNAIKLVPEWGLSVRRALKAEILLINAGFLASTLTFACLLASGDTRPEVLAYLQRSATWWQNEVFSVPLAAQALPVAVGYFLTQIPSLFENPVRTVLRNGTILERVHEALAAVSTLAILYTFVWAYGGNQKEFVSPFSSERKQPVNPPSVLPASIETVQRMEQIQPSRMCFDNLQPDGIGPDFVEQRNRLAVIGSDKFKIEFLPGPGGNRFCVRELDPNAWKELLNSK